LQEEACPGLGEQVIIRDTMSLTPGTRLDVYEILGQIGSGGMGEVYRARDSVLKREVAIKVLPPFVSLDPDRLRRFQQEAEAAAKLNHPNILAVHQLGSFEGSPYLVSELLEGDTLRQLMQRGPLPVRKTIDYGVQIAHGLAAAHEKGIVHRDLKPENLFVTKDGRVKILDFGLAKLTQRTPDPGDSGPTLTHQGTEPGLVMGTVGYMAPEQVRGQTVDHRADIFAFGAILYEMLAGKRAFEKPTTAETITAILNEDPPAISQIVRSTPPGLQRVVHRCLEKNAEQRFQSASDLAFALEAISESGSGSVAAITQGSRSWRVWTALACGAVVALVALFIAWWRIPPAVPVVESVTQLTDDGERKGGVVVSDGTRIYFNEGSYDNWKIAQMSVTGGPTTFLETKVATPFIAALAHDGSALLTYGRGDFATGFPLWMIPLPAGEPRRIGSFEVEYAYILPDGRITFNTVTRGEGDKLIKSDLFIADKDGFNPRRLATASGFIRNVDVSPDGERVLFDEDRNDTHILHEIAADGTGLREVPKPGLHDGTLFTWSSNGKYLLYMSGPQNRRDIWALPVATSLFRRSREPIRLTTGPLSYIAPNRNGDQILATAIKGRGELDHFDLKLHQFSPFLSGISATDPSFSRDGKWVVYHSFPDGNLWRSRTDGSERMQLTSPQMQTTWPWISPDGTKVTFGSNGHIFLIDMNGGQPQQIIDEGKGGYWSPDGNFLDFQTSKGIQIFDLHSGKITPVPGGQHMWGGFWVTQDTLVAGTDAPNRQSKYLTFDFKTKTWTDLFTATVENAMISPDNKYLYFTTGGAESKVERFRFADRQIETITSLTGFRELRSGFFQISVAPDGSPILIRDTSTYEIYALKVRWP
jgi:eukaryotic-like serine/threonine-protein kinase